MVIIKHNADDNSKDKKVTKIAFKDIKKVSLPTKSEDKLIFNLDCEKPWCYCFFLHTDQRKYYIYTMSTIERDMWMSGFQFLVLSTNHVIHSLT